MKYILLFKFIFLLIFANVAFSASSGLSGLPQKVNAPGQKMFVFSPRLHQWAAYDASGNRVSKGVANGGSSFCSDIGRRCHTPTGSYRLMRKGGSDCKSSLYPIKRKHGRVVRGGAPMPYCMFFSSSYAIHGYPHLTNSNVSHGCIRVATGSALWLRQYLPIGAKVVIQSY